VSKGWGSEVVPAEAGIDDELTCIVYYTYHPPDPDVGYMFGDIQIDLVDYNGFNVTCLFDLETLHDLIMDQMD